MTETNLGRIIGPEGPAGKSAYQYAQEGGFEGSEQEFTEKLATEYPTFSNLREAAPVNILDNSDFTHFVAQAGLNGKHGVTSYIGDRWIFANGSVSGNARSDGSGYTNITITANSEITTADADMWQFLPDYNSLVDQPFTIAIMYGDGTIRCGNFKMGDGSVVNLDPYFCISYSGQHILMRLPRGKTAIIKWIMCIPGTYTLDTLPEYHPKGYATELLECMRYYQENWVSYASYIGNNNAIAGISYPVKMRINPTVEIYDEAGNKGYIGIWGQQGVYKVSTAPSVTTRLFYLVLENYPSTQTLVVYRAVSIADL